MMALVRLLARLRHETCGTMVIETAIVAPVLVMMSLGAFDASRMVARQNELQQAVAEAGQIALASKPDTQAKRDTIKSIIRTSTGLAASNVTVSNEYRCNAATARVTTNTCAGGDTVTTYLKIVVTDTYTPLWTDFGIGSALNYSLTRLVIVA